MPLSIALLLVAPWARARTHPRVISVCMSLLTIRQKGPTARIPARQQEAVARAKDAVERNLVDAFTDEALTNSLRQIELIQRDLDDPRTLKTVLFVDGASDIREITTNLDLMSAQLDRTLDGALKLAGSDSGGLARTAVLSVVPKGGDRFHHFSAAIRVAKEFTTILDKIAAHDEVDGRILRRVIEVTRDLPGDEDLLLFDQFVYRKSAAAEYTYLSVVRVRGPDAQPHAAH